MYMYVPLTVCAVLLKFILWESINVSVQMIELTFDNVLVLNSQLVNAMEI